MCARRPVCVLSSELQCDLCRRTAFTRIVANEAQKVQMSASNAASRIAPALENWLRTFRRKISCGRSWSPAGTPVMRKIGVD